MNKLMHALFSFDTTAKISISHIQRLASLISRVSILSKHMRPYTVTLHAITSGYDQPHVRIPLSVLAQSDVMMWRAFVLLLITNPEKLSRPMESFRPQNAHFCIKYDASLTGIGVGIYNVNTMEVVAVVFGRLLAGRLQLQNFSYTLHGDNISSLAWA